VISLIMRLVVLTFMTVDVAAMAQTCDVELPKCSVCPDPHYLPASRYLEEVRKIVEDSWSKPSRPTRGPIVKVVILRNGSIKRVDVIQSAGKKLDKLARKRLSNSHFEPWPNSFESHTGVQTTGTLEPYYDLETPGLMSKRLFKLLYPHSHEFYAPGGVD
jgi:outer membrane biosynthesis protein TonB